MTPDAQRIAIAEACGWTEIQTGFVGLNSGKSLLCASSCLHGVIPSDSGKHEDEQHFIPLPDYINDLNAMHEAVGTLTDEEYGIYRRILWEVAAGKDRKEFERLRNERLAGKDDLTRWHGRGRHYNEATAAQRAEAFLRAIGKWVENENGGAA